MTIFVQIPIDGTKTYLPLIYIKKQKRQQIQKIDKIFIHHFEADDIIFRHKLLLIVCQNEYADSGKDPTRSNFVM